MQNFLRTMYAGCLLALVGFVANSQGQAAVEADHPSGVEGGYDGYIRTGSAVREETDFRVAGAVKQYRLHWTRTYDSRRTQLEFSRTITPFVLRTTS